jgi:monoamine oxidase
MIPQAAAGQPTKPEVTSLSRLSRRTVLRAAGGSLLGAGAAAFLRGPIGAQARRVIIVGAGIAGIAAANMLEDEGFDVVVLESRTRVGGRIWTDTSWGIPLDRGASWIHGAANANPIWALRNRYGLRTLATDYDDITVYDVAGRRVSSSQLEADFRAYRQIYRRARRWGSRQDEDSSLQDGIDEAIGQRDLPPYDRRALNFQINWNVEQDYGGSASDLSNLQYDQDSWLGGRQDAYVRDGYGALIAVLADGLDIRTGNPVLSIDYSSSGVTVRTARTDFRGAYAVVTVPLGVLAAERIEFTPRLPIRKRESLRALNMGTLNKTFLLFPRKFWGASEWIGYQANTRGYWALWLDLEPAVNAPVLVAFNAAAYGAALEQKSAQQVENEAMRVLRTIYGNAIPDPERTIITRWNADQHTLGAYSHIPPGARGRDYRKLALPSGNRLFWAGEATIKRYPQTVAGAYLSGQRAARQIIDLE